MCQIVKRTPIPKFHLTQGFRKLWLLPYNGPKIVLLNFLEPAQCARGDVLFFLTFKLKKKRNSTKMIVFFDQVKNNLAHFMSQQELHIKKCFISNFFFMIVRMIFANFPKKYSFLRSLWFFVNESFASRAPHACSQTWRLKKLNFLIGNNVPILANRKKF